MEILIKQLSHLSAVSLTTPHLLHASQKVSLEISTESTEARHRSVSEAPVVHTHLSFTGMQMQNCSILTGLFLHPEYVDGMSVNYARTWLSILTQVTTHLFTHCLCRCLTYPIQSKTGKEWYTVSGEAGHGKVAARHSRFTPGSE